MRLVAGFMRAIVIRAKGQETINKMHSILLLLFTFQKKHVFASTRFNFQLKQITDYRVYLSLFRSIRKKNSFQGSTILDLFFGAASLVVGSAAS